MASCSHLPVFTSSPGCSSVLGGLCPNGHGSSSGSHSPGALLLAAWSSKCTVCLIFLLNSSHPTLGTRRMGG